MKQDTQICEQKMFNVKLFNKNKMVNKERIKNQQDSLDSVFISFDCNRKFIQFATRLHLDWPLLGFWAMIYIGIFQGLLDDTWVIVSSDYNINLEQQIIFKDKYLNEVMRCNLSSFIKHQLATSNSSFIRLLITKCR